MAYEGDIYIDATIMGMALGKSSKGTVQLGISCKPDDPQHGHNLVAYMFFSDASLPYTEKALRDLGWDPVQNAWAIDELVINDTLGGTRVTLVCAWEEFEGKNRLKVKFINPLGGGGGMKDQMSNDEARGFTAALRQRLGVMGGVSSAPRPHPMNRTPATAGRPQSGPPADDPRFSNDDIPF